MLYSIRFYIKCIEGNHMKKFIIILLFLVVLISVCGCVSCAEITSAFANNEYITIYEINAICKNYTSSDIDFFRLLSGRVK